MNPASPAPRHGVSLIETIMVIALLAAAVVTSSIMFDREWVARRGVTSVTNDVANSLITARNTAITNQATVRVRRARSSGMEQLLFTEDAGPFRPSKNWIVQLGSDVRLRGSPVEIQFTPTGTANRGLTWTISRSRSSGEVSVAPASGQVSRRLP
jgi:hypothetical protein